MIVAGGPLPDWPPATAVVTVPWPRNERAALVGVKTISYGENVVALAYARERGAGEAIFANLAGNLCEGTGTNVFVAVGGRLVTPPLSSGCLAGVTRDLLLELLDVVEEDLPLSALASAGRGVPQLEHEGGAAHLRRRRPGRCPSLSTVGSPVPPGPGSASSSNGTSTRRAGWRQSEPRSATHSVA